MTQNNLLSHPHGLRTSGNQLFRGLGRYKHIWLWGPAFGVRDSQRDTQQTGLVPAQAGTAGESAVLRPVNTAGRRNTQDCKLVVMQDRRARVPQWATFGVGTPDDLMVAGWRHSCKLHVATPARMCIT